MMTAEDICLRYLVKHPGNIGDLIYIIEVKHESKEADQGNRTEDT